MQPIIMYIVIKIFTVKYLRMSKPTNAPKQEEALNIDI